MKPIIETKADLLEELRLLKKENQKLQEALTTSEQVFYQTVYHSPNFIFSVDREFIIRKWNLACHNTIKERLESAGKPIEIVLWDESEAEKIKQLINKVFDKKIYYGIEITFKDKIGKYRKMLSRLYPLISAKGHVIECIIDNTDITEHYKLVENILETEERYRNIIESTPMGIHMYELKGGELILTGYNPAADNILDIDHINLVGKNINDAFPAMAGTKIPELYKKTCLTGEPWKTESINYQDDRIKGAVEVYAFSNSPNKMVAMFMDITERKKADERIRESEEKYRNILENINEVIFTIDTVGNIKYITNSIEKISGYNTEELAGKNFREFIYLPDRDFVDKKFMEVAQGNTEPAEFRIITKSGESRWVSTSSKPVFKENSFTAINGVLTDVHRRKLAEIAMKESEELFRAVFDKSAIGMSLISLNGKFLKANDNLCEMLGYPEKELLGKSFQDFTHPNEKGIGKRFFEDLLNKNINTAKFDKRYVRKDGKTIWVSLTATVIYDSDKMPLHIVTHAMNITKRKMAEAEISKLNIELENRVEERTEQLNKAIYELRNENEEHMRTRKELEKAKERLEQALKEEKELNQMKTRFISMVSHEYRTPLTIIMSYAELIKIYNSGANRDQIEKYLNKITSSVNILTGLLEDVILVGKSEEKDIIQNMTDVDIPEVMQKVMDEIKIVDKNNHPLEFVNEAKTNRITTDPKLLRQMTLNLLSNACKYSPKDEPVKLHLTEKDENIELKVIDRGKGISPDQKKNLFKPFSRDKKFIGVVPGSGLGLTIVKKCADALNATIDVDTGEDRGTTFIVRMPRKMHNHAT